MLFNSYADCKVVVRLQGGLGNQMFQAAAALALLKSSPSILQVHLANYHEDSSRAYLLSVFGGAFVQLPHREAKSLLTNARELKNGWAALPYLKWIARMQGWRIVSDHEDLPPELQISGKVYVDGLWQRSTFWLLKNEVRIREWFQFDPKKVAGVEDQADRLRRGASVAVHVRRGDYATTGFQVLDAHYYYNALAEINRRLNNVSFFVFSDEPVWARSIIGWPEGTEFVEGHPGQNCYLDLYLMSQARHHVIANSTFSWWAAWLAKGGGVVIYPQIPGWGIFEQPAFPMRQAVGLELS